MAGQKSSAILILLIAAQTLLSPRPHFHASGALRSEGPERRLAQSGLP
jgi:hypothetical protein